MPTDLCPLPHNPCRLWNRAQSPTKLQFQAVSNDAFQKQLASCQLCQNFKTQLQEQLLVKRCEWMSKHNKFHFVGARWLVQLKQTNTRHQGMEMQVLLGRQVALLYLWLAGWVEYDTVMHFSMPLGISDHLDHWDAITWFNKQTPWVLVVFFRSFDWMRSLVLSDVILHSKK